MSQTTKRSVKVNMKQREQIFKLYGTGKYTQDQLAEKFGVSQSRICQILRAQRAEEVFCSLG